MTVETRDEEIPTGHGETVNVEVVDCCSCEQTTPVEKTALVVVMDYDESDKRYSNSTEWESSEGNYEEGRICERCRSEPIKWPDRYWINASLGGLIWGLIFGAMLTYTLMTAAGVV